MAGVDHDQSFKNLILDYPRDALAFFAPSIAARRLLWEAALPAKERIMGVWADMEARAESKGKAEGKAEGSIRVLQDLLARGALSLEAYALELDALVQRGDLPGPVAEEARRAVLAKR